MSIVYPQMLQISKDGYTSLHAVMYQRLTVILSEILLFIAILKYTREYSRKHLEIICLVFFMPALIYVDHIHFQYNGFLYGLQMLSLISFKNGKYLMGALYFAAVLNFKHIFLYQAPAYFVYLLSIYCFKSGSFSLLNFIKVGSVVIAIFGISFSMFLGQLGQIIKRLFPFKRGLCHACNLI